MEESARGGCSHFQSCSLPATRQHFKSIHSIHFHLRIPLHPSFPLLASLISGLSGGPEPPVPHATTLLLRKLSPLRFRPTSPRPSTRGKGIVKIRLSLNERVAETKPNFRYAYMCVCERDESVGEAREE